MNEEEFDLAMQSYELEDEYAEYIAEHADEIDDDIEF